MMKLALRSNKDFWAGLMFFAFGAVGMFVARDYPFGTMLRMGPGYFPMMISGLLIFFGLIVMIRGLRSNESIQGHWSIRGLILLPISMVVFGILMEYTGFIPAMTALIFLSAASGREFRFVEVLLLTVGLSVLSIAMFIWGLGLPYLLFKKFW